MYFYQEKQKIIENNELSSWTRKKLYMGKIKLHIKT